MHAMNADENAGLLLKTAKTTSTTTPHCERWDAKRVAQHEASASAAMNGKQLRHMAPQAFGYLFGLVESKTSDLEQQSGAAGGMQSAWWQHTLMGRRNLWTGRTPVLHITASIAHCNSSTAVPAVPLWAAVARVKLLGWDRCCRKLASSLLWLLCSFEIRWTPLRHLQGGCRLLQLSAQPRLTLAELE